MAPKIIFGAKDKDIVTTYVNIKFWVDGHEVRREEAAQYPDGRLENRHVCIQVEVRNIVTDNAHSSPKLRIIALKR